MKKCLSMILALAMTVSLAACGGDGGKQPAGGSGSNGGETKVRRQHRADHLPQRHPLRRRRQRGRHLCGQRLFGYRHSGRLPVRQL